MISKVSWVIYYVLSWCIELDLFRQVWSQDMQSCHCTRFPVLRSFVIWRILRRSRIVCRKISQQVCLTHKASLNSNRLFVVEMQKILVGHLRDLAKYSPSDVKTILEKAVRMYWLVIPFASLHLISCVQSYSFQRSRRHLSISTQKAHQETPLGAVLANRILPCTRSGHIELYDSTQTIFCLTNVW